MTKKLKFGLESQSYAAPRAESVALGNDGLLLSASGGDGLGGNSENFELGNAAWDGIGGSPEGMNEEQGSW